MSYMIKHRKRVLINTDPQRRCYNGAHFSCEVVWSEWGDLEPMVTQEAAEKRIEFWQGLTAYAVSQRGKSAECEYKIEVAS